MPQVDFTALEAKIEAVDNAFSNILAILEDTRKKLDEALARPTDPDEVVRKIEALRQSLDVTTQKALARAALVGTPAESQIPPGV